MAFADKQKIPKLTNRTTIRIIAFRQQNPGPMCLQYTFSNFPQELQKRLKILDSSHFFMNEGCFSFSVVSTFANFSSFFLLCTRTILLAILEKLKKFIQKSLKNAFKGQIISKKTRLRRQEAKSNRAIDNRRVALFWARYHNPVEHPEYWWGNGAVG